MLSKEYIAEILYSAIPIYQMYFISFLLECYATKKRKKISIIVLNISANTILNHFIILKIKSFFVRMWCMVFFVLYLLKLVSFHIENNKQKDDEDEVKKKRMFEDTLIRNIPFYDQMHNKKQGNRRKRDTPELKNESNNNTKVTTKKLSFPNFFSYFFLPTLIYKHKFCIKYTINITEIAQNITKMYLTAVSFFIIKENICLVVLEKLVEKNRSLVVVLYMPILFASVFTCWLLLFYFYFTLFLGSLKKIANFDDHVIYKDWWNAETIGEFWRKWNIPFYLWVKKYIFLELKKEK